MPVKSGRVERQEHPGEDDEPLISPALAFLYNPLGSLASTTSNGASTNTSINGNECFSCNSLASCRSVL